MLNSFGTSLVPWIWVAGAVQLILVVANVFLPGILDYRSNLARVQPVIRQIFVVHSIYLVLILLIFSRACLFFAADLAGASRIGRFFGFCACRFSSSITMPNFGDNGAFRTSPIPWPFHFSRSCSRPLSSMGIHE